MVVTEDVAYAFMPPKVYALDTTTGGTLWSENLALPAQLLTTPACASKEGHLVVASRIQGLQVAVLDKLTGRSLALAPFAPDGARDPQAYRGPVLVAAPNESRFRILIAEPIRGLSIIGVPSEPLVMDPTPPPPRLIDRSQTSLLIAMDYANATAPDLATLFELSHSPGCTNPYSVVYSGKINWFDHLNLTQGSHCYKYRRASAHFTSAPSPLAAFETIPIPEPQAPSRGALNAVMAFLLTAGIVLCAAGTFLLVWARRKVVVRRDKATYHVVELGAAGPAVI
jgi:hypothetical protein